MWFSNAPEYEARLNKPFIPPTVTLKEIHDAVPKELMRKDAIRSASYIVRDVIFCSLLMYFACSIETMVRTGFWGYLHLSASWQMNMLRAVLWLWYWWWQGLVFTSFFCIGVYFRGGYLVCDRKSDNHFFGIFSLAHEMGHGALFDSWYANNITGFIMDSFILVPFFAWKASHNAHHKAVGSVERDENYVPYTRSDYKLPPQKAARWADYAEVFDETPIMTLSRLLIMQVFGWWLYLSCNAMGSRLYPEGTNHFSPYSPIFRKEQRWGIIASDIGLAAMTSLLFYVGFTYGGKTVLMYYFIPYMLCNHWIVLCTFLHHSDPTIPHYRKEEWTFLRGAAATVDRPILGWMGRFFFHNVSHDHVAHHFFSQAPFYNQPKITEAIRSVLKDDYNFDSTNSLYALYRSFTECVFIEDEGAIVFYKNAEGEASRHVADGVLRSPTSTSIKEKSWCSGPQNRLHLR